MMAPLLKWIRSRYNTRKFYKVNISAGTGGWFLDARSPSTQHEDTKQDINDETTVKTDNILQLPKAEAGQDIQNYDDSGNLIYPDL